MAVAVRSQNGHRAAAAFSPAIDPVPFEHEELVVRRGRRSGLDCVVAIHSTTLGPALGGVRMWAYPETADGARDAMRLAGAMTLKAAAAGLELGGGKGVVCAPPGGLNGDLRRAALHDFGDLVESLDGRYITAEDVGTSPDDLVVIAERTSHVTGLPPDRGGSGDPSPLTALGVEAGMRACTAARFGTRELAGLRVCLIGLGHVGSALARQLVEAGCELLVADVDEAKRAGAAALGAVWIDPVEAVATECDVLAPCALGGTISAENVDRLRCEIVCGSANNQLADDSLAGDLDRRGVLYAPDFIANAGGLINVYREIKGYDTESARRLVLGIEQTMTRILEESASSAVTPLEAARTLAEARLSPPAEARPAVR
jgi:leucine dehydrogenase